MTKTLIIPRQQELLEMPTSADYYKKDTIMEQPKEVTANQHSLVSKTEFATIIAHGVMYKIPKAIKVNVGDTVVVRFCNNLTLVVVQEVFEDDRIDYNSQIVVDWIVDTIDTHWTNQLREADEQVIERIATVRRHKAVKQLRKGVKAILKMESPND